MSMSRVSNRLLRRPNQHGGSSTTIPTAPSGADVAVLETRQQPVTVDAPEPVADSDSRLD
ncbi:MAG: hypothetical protein WKF73_20840 [Nocardioidaceae bacterium]